MLDLKTAMQLQQENSLSEEYAAIEGAIVNYEFDDAEELLRECHLPYSWKQELIDTLKEYRRKDYWENNAYDAAIGN